MIFSPFLSGDATTIYGKSIVQIFFDHENTKNLLSKVA